ncbi:unnamed protein product, partial [Ectocarpus sp. 12 AP-2014]
GPARVAAPGAAEATPRDEEGVEHIRGDAGDGAAAAEVDWDPSDAAGAQQSDHGRRHGCSPRRRRRHRVRPQETASHGPGEGPQEDPEHRRAAHRHEIRLRQRQAIRPRRRPRAAAAVVLPRREGGFLQQLCVARFHGGRGHVGRRATSL